MSKGKFVVFEGLDRSGKTTAVKRVYEMLSPIHPTEKIRFPNRDTEIGRIIDRYLRREMALTDETIHLLFSCDRYEKRALINELRKEKILLSDRYSMSGIAFSARKGLDLEWCKSADMLLPRPDLVVFLDVPSEELIRRGGFGDEIYESREIQQEALAVYRRLLKGADNVLVVDGTLPVDEVATAIVNEILK
jgi:dTMP kinase